jgi:hypothetical protein
LPAKVDLNNVDSPEIERQMHRGNRFIQFAGAAIWAFLISTALQKGHDHGLVDANTHRKLIIEEKAAVAEREKLTQETWAAGHTQTDPSVALLERAGGGLTGAEGQHTKGLPSGGQSAEFEVRMRDGAPILLKDFTVRDIANEKLLESLNAGEVENLILAIYANRGAEFESRSAQQWADRQPWYTRVPGRGIKQAETFFNVTDEYNVEQLARRWNELQVEEGLAAVPVDAGPLAGRAVSPDLEGEAVSDSEGVEGSASD